jgi:hypothetical protein
MSWHTLAAEAPELAAFGAQRLHDQVAYLATLRPDGAPDCTRLPLTAETNMRRDMAERRRTPPALR